jgi:hypothetical protein
MELTMSIVHRRIRILPVSLCAAMVATVALPSASLFASVGTATPASAAPPLFSALKLDVSPAHQSTAKHWPDAVGTPLKHYKWLIQQDNTGDSNQPSGPVASNDGTITATGALHSPSAPFLQADAGVGISGAGLAANAKIVTFVDAQDVIVSGFSGAVPPAGTYLFSILRADPCHPVTPNTLQGDPNFPQNCHWPSIISAQHPPVVTQGDETDWSTALKLSGVMTGVDGKPTTNPATRCVINDPASCGGKLKLPDGKYFVSVSADGYEIGGTSFTIPSTSAMVNVRLNPGPLTLGTMKLLVFNDMNPTGGAYEATTESGMSGFTGSITDFTGSPVTQDYFGNPICTQYKTDANGNVLLKDDGTPVEITKIGGQCVSAPAPLGTLTNDAGISGTELDVALVPGVTDANLPIPGLGEGTPFTIQIGAEQMLVTAVCLSGGAAVSSPTCASFPTKGNVVFLVQRAANGTIAGDLKPTVTLVPDPSDQPQTDGIITIPNLAPGRYGANVTPPDPAWIETTTLEGGHDFDVWVMGNDNGLDNELIAAGEPVPFVQFGFARAAMATVDPGANPPATDTIKPVDPANPPTTGSFATAGCMVAPVSSADQSVPAGDIRAQLTKAMVPCRGTGIHQRIEPGTPGQNPTPDGSLEAQSWVFPWYDDPVYHLGNDPNNAAKAPKGEIKGRIAGTEPYVPGIGGLNGVGGANGQAGEQVANIPISDGWVALADLNNGDQTSLVAPAQSDGTFDIANVPDGTYNLAWWDWDQDYAFDAYQVTVQNGQILDEGWLPLSGWFTQITGHVFVDTNGNGKRDPGERGVPDFLMQLLNRTNNAWEGGQNTATTNDSGYYALKEAYPLGQDMVLQFYNPRYKTTGVTCQADNDPQAHTTVTPAVDLTTLNIIGLNGYCDIGIQPYSTDPTAGDNGGIVATAMYQSFRPDLSEEQSVTEPYDTGQPGVRFELWQPRQLPATASSAQVAANKGNKYLTCTQDNVTAGNITANDLGCGVWGYGSTGSTPDSYRLDGGLVRDPVPFDPNNSGQVAVYYSEHYQRGGANGYSQPGCVPRGADGQVLSYKVQEAVQVGGDCIESAMQGTSFSFGSDANPVDPKLYTNTVPSTDPRSLDPGLNTGNYDNNGDPYPGLNDYCKSQNSVNGVEQKNVFGANVNGGQCGIHGVQVVDGNYGLTPPQPGDYIVHPVVPNDMFGKPLYKFASEADVNIYDGPGWVPQNVSPTTQVDWTQIRASDPASPKPTHSDGYSITPGTGSPAPDFQCVGAQKLINNTDPSKDNYVDNPSFVAAYHGTPPFEGQMRAKCDSKLIHVQNGQSVAPNFLLYTDVPLAAVFAGYATDDISVSTNKLSTGLGEVQPIPNLPIGIYDWTGTQVSEVNTDYNGQWLVMLPSTNTMNCNTVAGPCPSVYRFVGNDPGQPASPNLNWNPTYRTIAAQFQAWPGEFMPSDVAPTRAVVAFEGQGSQYSAAAICAPRASTPQVFAVSHPFFKPLIAGAQAGPKRDARSDTYTLVIKGLGFGSKPNTLAGNPTLGVTLRPLDNSLLDTSGVHQIPLADYTRWDDNEVDLQLADNAGNLTGLSGIPAGPYQLVFTNANMLATTSAVTFHVLGSSYNPRIYEVGPFNTGVLKADGSPAGTAISDNGYIDPNMPGSAGPVQDLVDSTTSGFNPANGNFLPDGDATAQHTDGSSSYKSHGSPGDTFVKGAIQRSLEAAYHYWQTNIGGLSAPITATQVNIHVALTPGQTAQDLPPTPFTIVIGNERPTVTAVGATVGGVASLTVTRGPANGFARRAAHPADAPVTAVKTGQDQNLIVVYPNFVKDPNTGVYGGEAWDPLSAYFENIVVHSPVMLQGVGPGGYYKNLDGYTITTPGSTIDGRFFNANTSAPAAAANDAVAGNEPWAWDFEELVGAGLQNPDGLWTTQPFYNNLQEAEAEVVYVIGNVGWYTKDANGYRPSIDGLGITGGDQKGFADNISETLGGAGVQRAPDETFDIEVQGGGVVLQAEVTNFQVSNNLIQWNSGAYSGAIRSGSPQADPLEADPNAHNSNLHIHHNRIIADGGTNLAGAIGLFRGTDHYRINDNQICGNLSAEYGAGISHFGYSPGGRIDHNKIMLNQAIDEAGGIMIAGEPRINLNTNTPDPTLVSLGAGSVQIDDNYIGDNLAYDDGGGLRFLEAGVYPFNVTNNMITDNVSAHEGGGIAIDDAPDVRLVNDTVANNITTATAVTSTGDPAPAGVSTGGISTQLHGYMTSAATLPLDNGTVYPPGFSDGDPLPATTTNRTCASASVGGSAAVCAGLAAPGFSDPLMVNDVIWNNLAGTWDSLHSTVTGIGLPQNLINGPGCLAPATPCDPPIWDPSTYPWDVGVADGSDNGATKLAPRNTVLSSMTDFANPGTANNVFADPQFVQPYVVAIQSDPYRLNARFRPSTLITVNFPANVLGDYHIQSTSSARGAGTNKGTTAGATTVCVPLTDIDSQLRLPTSPTPGCAPNPPTTPDAGADQYGPGAVTVSFTPPPPAGPAPTPAAVTPPASPPTTTAPSAPGGGSSGSGGAPVHSGAGASGHEIGSGNKAHYAPPPPAPKPGAPGSRSPSAGRAGSLGINPAASPSGSQLNVASVGTPDAAGNTAVVAYPGLKVSGDGTPVVGPNATGQSAPVPGGALGGGKFLHHNYHRGSGSDTGLRIVGWLLAGLGLVAALGAAVRQRRRVTKRKHRRTRVAAADHPPDDDPAALRPLELAAKGDPS